ncbi:MAG TPA: hypothetical protein VGI97_07325, partial [Gemmatimonadaceae bacterium]
RHSLHSTTALRRSRRRKRRDREYREHFLHCPASGSVVLLFVRKPQQQSQHEEPDSGPGHSPVLDSIPNPPNYDPADAEREARENK